MKDCLLIGFNDTDFAEFVEMIRGMGERSGTFRDLNLAFAEIDGKPYRCLDLLNRLLDQEGLVPEKPYENCDFIWPVILYLGTYLNKRGFSFDYVNLFHREKERLVQLLAQTSYRAIAITTTVYVAPHAILEIVAFLREAGVDAPIVIGGPYISNQHRVMSQEELSMLFAFLGGDIYVISAEGESTLVSLLTQLRAGRALDDVPNLAVRTGDQDFRFHPLVPEHNELGEELPNYRLFQPPGLSEFISLRTAKSCPFACNFCGFPQRAGKYTYNPLEVVAKELDAIAELGTVTTLTFLDDTFNVPKARFRDILRLMIERNYGFRWNSFYRADHGDSLTIDLMAKAGCEGVFLGIESGSDTILSLMNKSARRANYIKALQEFRDVGICTYGSFIIGYPGETRATVDETIDLIETHRPTFYRTQLFYLDPATPVWRDREKLNVKGGGFEWEHPTMTCHQASDAIEEIFRTVKNSTWSPQHGFEDWSIYYLRRRGFTIDDVVAFVARFNSLVRTKFASAACDNSAILEQMAGIARTTRMRYLAQKNMIASQVTQAVN